MFSYVNGKTTSKGFKSLVQGLIYPAKPKNRCY